MNEHNLIPNSARTKEQLREMGRKGGIKSGQTRRKNRELRKLGKIMLSEINLGELWASLFIGGDGHDQ